MVQHKSTVSAARVLRQAVKNTSSSIELLREAVSNSVDAAADRIDVSLINTGGQLWNLVIQDNGNGMTEAHMMAFFNAGETVKDFEDKAIGEKGLGSKTTFVAKEIVVESRRSDAGAPLIVGRMIEPLAALDRGEMPEYTMDVDPDGYQPALVGHGTRIALTEVHIAKFNGKESSHHDEIAERVLHYLRSMCATGTVKNRHAGRQHILSTVMNVGVIPQLTLEVVTGDGTATLGPEPGLYQIPDVNLNPEDGPVSQGVPENSKKFCDVLDFNRARTISVGGEQFTVHYDGTAVIAGENVRAQMLKGELKQGWTQKSQMGVHLCKDFIPMRKRADLSSDLLDSEFYYEYKVFINCQDFQLNADRNVVTNEESDEIAWIWDDFKAAVWPTISSRGAPYQQMKRAEEAAIEAIKKTQQASELKGAYSTAANIAGAKEGVDLRFVKAPRREADISHLLAMMVQSGAWADELAPISRFGQYIDSSTDVLVEDEHGDAFLVEIELQLPNLFRHRHPMNSYDLVVVWELGGLTNGSTYNAPWGLNGSEVPVTLISGGGAHDWHLRWGTHNRRVIVLSEIL
jgi:hypothetical protein